MDKKRRLILIIAVIGMLGTFLPWASAFGYTVRGTRGDGWITFFLFAIGGAIAYFAGERQEPVDKAKLLGVWIPAGLAALIALRKVTSKPSGISIGIGLWLILLAGIAQVVHILFLKGDSVEAAPPPAPSPEPEKILQPPDEEPAPEDTEEDK